jgi:hypothetical protein
MLLPDVWPKTLKYIQTYTTIPDYMHMYIYLYPSETEYACIYFHTHTYTASESRRDRKHTCMHVHIHTCKTESRPNQKSPRSRGEDTGKGKGWLRFGPASETVQQNGARTRDLFVGFPARRAPDTLVKSHGADGRAGWNYGPASEGGVGQTGFEPTPAVFRRRGSNARGLSAWWVQTRLRRYLRGPPQRKSVTSESNTQPLCSRGTKYKATECLGAALPSA